MVHCSFTDTSYTLTSWNACPFVPVTPGVAGSGRTLDKPRTMDKG